jgi:hypothetical protein
MEDNMQTVIGYLLALSLIATLLVLVVGLIGMARGGDFNAKYNNIIMRARIGTQAFTVLMFIAYFVVGKL